MEIIAPKKENLSKIMALLRQGGILICPTDTVYGLICLAENEKAVEKIFEIKKRDKSKPLAVFVKDIESAKDLAIVGEREEEYLKNSKNTVILKAKSLPAQAGAKLSPLVYKNGTIGIRIPNYNFLNTILKEFGKPLAQTSANLSDLAAETKIKNIIFQFKDEDVLIIDAGDLPNSKASTIIDVAGNKIKILRK